MLSLLVMSKIPYLLMRPSADAGGYLMIWELKI